MGSISAQEQERRRRPARAASERV